MCGYCFHPFPECVCVCAHLCMCLCLCVCLCVCLFVCVVYVCVYVCAPVHVCREYVRDTPVPTIGLKYTGGRCQGGGARGTCRWYPQLTIEIPCCSIHECVSWCCLNNIYTITRHVFPQGQAEGHSVGLGGSSSGSRPGEGRAAL